MKKLESSELERISPEVALSAKRSNIVVVLDDIRSAHNVGSIFRTCDAFLIEHLHLCGITPKPPHREISKTALGATNSVNWSYHESVDGLYSQLKDEGYSLIAIEHTDSSTALQEHGLQKGEKVALLFGNEVNGLSAASIEACDRALEIPMFGSKHSFNVSVCAGIVLWELSRNP